MNKSDLIDAVAHRAELSKTAAARAVEAIFDTASGAISEAIRAGGQISLPGFGKFRSKVRPARKGRNPQTGAEIDIPERTVVQFQAGKGLQETLGGGGSSAGGSSSGGARGSAKKSAGAAKKSAGAAKSGGGAKSAGGAGAQRTADSAGDAGSGGATKSAGAAKKSAGATKSAGAAKSGGTAKKSTGGNK